MVMRRMREKMNRLLYLSVLISALSLSAAQYSADTQSPVQIPYAQDLNEEFLYYIFDWGDGIITPGSLKRSGIHGYMQHQYTDPGIYQGRYRAVNISGIQSDWTVFSVRVTGAVQSNYSAVIASQDNWSSNIAENYSERKSCELKLGEYYALDRLLLLPAVDGRFPSHFQIEYSINSGATWHKLNSAQYFFFPEPEGRTVCFYFNGIVANAVRLQTTRMIPGESVALGGMQLTGEKDFLFDCSEKESFIAGLNNMWIAFGSAANEVHLDFVTWGQSKRPFESGVSYMGNAEWIAWDALQMSWTKSRELDELRIKWLNYPLDPDGYVWACPADPRHLFHNRHYDNNACYISGIVHYYLQTGDDAFMQHVCTVTGKTNLEKVRLAMRYQLEQLGGTNGVLTITDPEVQGTAQSKTGNYWDYFKFGHQSAFDNAEFYRSLLSMAELECHLGNDQQSAEYEELAGKVKTKLNELFWNEKTGRYIGWIDQNGKTRDFGFTFVNQHILAYGLADKKRACNVLDWLDGNRVIQGESSIGKDIYAFGMSARANTVDMAVAPELVETWGGALDPDDEGKYGSSLQNGGTIFYTSYYDLHSRLRYQGIDSAMSRLNVIMEEFEKDELRRVNSNHVGHTLITGILLCFPESGLVPMFFIDGILGLQPVADGLIVKPSLPAQWEWASVKQYWFHGKQYSIRADRSVENIQITYSDRIINIILPAAGTFVVKQDGTCSLENN